MFDGMESDYEKQWKRSDHRLRPREKDKTQKREPDQNGSMEGYESSEEEKKEKKEPVEQIVLKGSDRRFSAGYNREGRLTMVFSKDKNDGRQKDEEIFRKEGSIDSKRNRKYLRTGTHRLDKGAQILEDREEKRKKYLLDQVGKTAGDKDESLVGQAFPFLSTKEEKERIRMLEDEASKYSTDTRMVEAARALAERLAVNVAHKEEEQRDILKKLTAQVTAEAAKKKERRWEPPKQDRMNLVEDKAEGDENHGEDGENEKKGEMF